MDDQVISELPGAATSISPTADGGSAATAASGRGAGPGAGTAASSNAQWPTKVADTIEDVVGAVHDKLIRPLIVVARGLVFGVVIGLMAILMAILMTVAVVRLLTVYLFSGRVWASDALVGALFLGLGVAAWSYGRSKDTAGEG